MTVPALRRGGGAPAGRRRRGPARAPPRWRSRALELIPGDPVAILLGPATAASPAVRHQIAAQYGIDQPLAVRYVRFLGRLAHGDLGRSYQLQRPVSSLIAEQLGPTAQLAGAAVVVALAIAVVSAVATAGRRPALRGTAIAGELLAVSVPSYWAGILLLTAFSFQLHVFPVAGDQGLAALVLPATTLALPVAGVLAQVLREGLEAALAEPFAVTARARGLSQTAVRLRHGLRHAAAPLLTLTGWLTGTLFGGAVLVETVFGRPGHRHPDPAGGHRQGHAAGHRPGAAVGRGVRDRLDAAGPGPPAPGPETEDPVTALADTGTVPGAVPGPPTPATRAEAGTPCRRRRSSSQGS